MPRRQRGRGAYGADDPSTRERGDARVPTMERRSVLVTGGNSGIGFECARELARRGWHVVIASRDRAASAAAVARIAAESGAGTIEELGLDLASPISVRSLVGDIRQRELRLGALVCNAGLQMHQGPRLTPDGFELTFAVNHLGHFLLTQLLLGRLLANPPARIVVVASGVHDPKMRTGMPKPAVTDIATLAATGGPRAGEFNGRLAYVNSKLCNLWFTYELVRRLERAGLAPPTGPTVNGFDPGLVPGSGLARDYPAPLRFVWDRVGPTLARGLTHLTPTINPAPKSGAALARLVLDPSLATVTGRYFPSHSRWHDAPSSDASYDTTLAARLWDESLTLAKLAPGESPR